MNWNFLLRERDEEKEQDILMGLEEMLGYEILMGPLGGETRQPLDKGIGLDMGFVTQAIVAEVERGLRV